MRRVYCRCNLGHSGAGVLQLLYSIMGAAGVLPGWATLFVYQRAHRCAGCAGPRCSPLMWGEAVSLLGVHLLTASGSFYTLLHNSQRQPAHKHTHTRQGSNYRVSKQQAFGSVRGCGLVSTLRCTLIQAAQHTKPGCSFEARTKCPCVDFNCSAGRCKQLGT